VVLYVLVCIFLILVVLLQQGKGADLAGAFGGGGSQTSFGPRTAANIMHRMTTVSFVLFVVLSLALSILSGKGRDSVMDSAGIPGSQVAGETEGAGTEPQIAPVTDEDAEPVPDSSSDPVVDEAAAEPANDDTEGAADGE
jgi:preprotein translocase subunit SecG